MNKTLKKLILKQLVYLNALLLVLVPVNISAATDLYFIHNDHLGTPQVVTDQNQTVVWTGNKKPFGETDEGASTTEQLARFPGQYLDQESGLHYNYFRDYDWSIGRYLQSDPIGLGGGLNTYGYVEGNPVRYVDSEGLAIQAIGRATYVVTSAAIRTRGGQAVMRWLSDLIWHAFGDDAWEDATDNARDQSQEKDGCDDDGDECGSKTRTQALAEAQALAKIPRSSRTSRVSGRTVPGRTYLPLSHINRTSRGAGYAGLAANGAAHSGYFDTLNTANRIEDHPDGHPNMPGEAHHSCPHIHVYGRNGETLAIIIYRRN